jgi:hypothetical protein
MQYQASTPTEYIAQVPPERQPYLQRLHDIILEHLPQGFESEIQYGMIGYVVPKQIYPAGYHCDPKLPLPFASIASQKNSINFYHMGMYADPDLLDWFVIEYPKHTKQKLDMGKSCVRFSKPDLIPFELIGDLMTKTSVDAWIAKYEALFRKQ